MVDQTKFCAVLKGAPFNLGDPARASRAGFLIDAAETLDPHMDVRWLAYGLATALYESGFTLMPVREVGEGRGHAYGQVDPVTHQAYYGRGYVQTTWKANYEKVGALIKQDLVHDPDLLLDPKFAAPALFAGMEKGLYTGKSFATYFHGSLSDSYNARRIINGLDHASEIAGLYKTFLGAITASQS